MKIGTHTLRAAAKSAAAADMLIEVAALRYYFVAVEGFLAADGDILPAARTMERARDRVLEVTKDPSLTLAAKAREAKEHADNLRLGGTQ